MDKPRTDLIEDRFQFAGVRTAFGVIDNLVAGIHDPRRQPVGKYSTGFFQDQNGAVAVAHRVFFRRDRTSNIKPIQLRRLTQRFSLQQSMPEQSVRITTSLGRGLDHGCTI